MSLALIGSVQVQRDVSIGVLAGAWTASGMPNSRTLSLFEQIEKLMNLAVVPYKEAVKRQTQIEVIPVDTFPRHRRKDRRTLNNGRRSGGSGGYLLPVDTYKKINKYTIPSLRLSRSFIPVYVYRRQT